MLQRKEVWSTEEVCSYFKINDQTLRRGSKKGEWPKPFKVGGYNFYKLIDLKDMFRDRDGNTDTLDKLLG